MMTRTLATLATLGMTLCAALPAAPAAAQVPVPVAAQTPLPPAMGQLHRLYPGLTRRWQRAAGVRLKRARGGLTLAPGEAREGLEILIPTDASRSIVVTRGSLRVEHSLVGAKAVSGRVEGGLVRYRGALPHTEALVLADGDSIEQMLLVDSPRAPKGFLMRLRIRGGTLAEESDGSISLRDDRGRPALRLTRPVAIDARGRARPGHWSLRESGPGYYTAALVLDRRGLSYPILID